MPLDNLSLVLAERPKDSIIPGTTFSKQTTPAPTPADLKEGEILVEVLYLSLDPAMRGWLNGMSQSNLHYHPRPFSMPSSTRLTNMLL